MRKNIGKEISELRHAKELTQEKVAEAMGVSPQAVSKWENNISCPDIFLLPKLSRLLGVSVDELLSGEDIEEAHVTPCEKAKGTHSDDLVLRINILKLDNCNKKDEQVHSRISAPFESRKHTRKYMGKCRWRKY